MDASISSSQHGAFTSAHESNLITGAHAQMALGGHHSPEDSGIAALYRGAAFCLYPSRYEGYGLPVVEAFSYGKAVLASTGGALPEVVDGFSPCLDPLDAEAWRRMLRTWIEDPSRAPAMKNPSEPHSAIRIGRKRRNGRICRSPTASRLIL